MRIGRQVFGAATIVLASFLALSCNNAYGIFQAVQGETKQNGSKVFQETTAKTAFRLGGYYYASTARLYRRLITDTSWSQVDIGGTGTYFLRSVVLVNVGGTTPTIYALTGDSSSDVALYSSTDASNWTQVSLPSTPVVVPAVTYWYAFDALYSANNQLFAVGHVFEPMIGDNSGNGTSFYDLYNVVGSTFTPVSNFTTRTLTIRGVVGDGTSNYWFASEDQLYSSASATNLGGLSLGTNSKTIWGISYTGITVGHLYITTKDGYLYRDDYSQSEGLTSIPLTTVIEVPSPSGNILLVGTDTDDVNYAAIGYFEGAFGSLVVGSTNSYISSTSSIYNTTVSVFPVHAFYYDSTLSNLFVCISPGTSSTSYYGLYESSWNTSAYPNAWSGWSAQ
jgi:hypothetical protein